MQIKLLSLKLKNFKGVESFELNVDGSNAIVYGRNGAGKSTLADAISWLLFDKDASGNSKFSVKTLNDQGQELHNLEHEVEASIGLSDTTSTTLRKTMNEKWVKRRGQSNPEFGGHETSYYINDVPKKKGEYEEFVAGIAREDLFRMLTSTTYFNTMKWQDRRALLLEVVGDITDADVIARDDLARVPEVLGNHSHEDAVKVLKASRKKVADDIDGIGPRIDEVERSKPEKGTAVPPKCGKTYRELQDELQKLQNERAALLAGDTTSAREEVFKLKERMAKEDEKYHAETREQQKERAILSAAIEQAGVSLRRIESIIEQGIAEIQRLDAANKELRAEFAVVNSAEAPASVCQTCGQALPEDQAEEIRAKFQLQKADKLKGIREAGIKNNSKIDELKAGIEKSEAEHERLVSEQEMAQETHDDIEMPDAPDHSQILGIISGIEADMAKTSTTPDTGKVDAKIDAVRADIQQFDDTAAAVKRLSDADKRISELKSSQKALGNELDRIDADLVLLEEFTRAKVGMLESLVADKFSPLSFRLFETQINGGLRETCETLIPSPEGAMVPYSDANTGHKILAGLRIIEVLGEHYGVHAPVIIDNAESLTVEVPEIGSQIIRLVASEAHAELTVQVVQETEASPTTREESRIYPAYIETA